MGNRTIVSGEPGTKKRNLFRDAIAFFAIVSLLRDSITA